MLVLWAYKLVTDLSEIDYYHNTRKIVLFFNDPVEGAIRFEMSLNTRVEYGEAADLEKGRSTAQTVSRSRQFYAPVVPDVSSRGRLHNIEPSELNQTKIKSRSKTKNMLNNH